MRAGFLIIDAVFSLCPLMVEGAGELSGISYKRTLILFIRAPSYDLINRLSKAASPNNVTLEVRFQHTNFVRGTHSVYTHAFFF